MELKNKLLIGLLLAAQVSGVIAFNGGERDEWRWKMYQERLAAAVKNSSPSSQAEYKMLKSAANYTLLEKLYNELNSNNCFRYTNDKKPENKSLCANLQKQYTEAGHVYDNATHALLLFENNLMRHHEAAPKSESQLRAEYKVYVANSDPYTAMYTQRAAQLEKFNTELTAIKKQNPTNKVQIKKLEEEIEYWNSYDPGRNQQIRGVLPFNEWVSYRESQR